MGGAQDYSRYQCILDNQLMDVCIVQIQCINIMCYVFVVIVSDHKRLTTYHPLLFVPLPPSSHQVLISRLKQLS